jgi:Tol biopolymer transport system component
MISGKSICQLLLIAFAAAQCSRGGQQQTAISYPVPQPDSIAVRFLPGIVSNDSLDFNSAFSPDGKSFYFSRSGKGKWMIYVTELQAGSWSKPRLAPFNEPRYSQADPFITLDGTLYYISNRPKTAGDTVSDYDIWRIRPRPNGSWTKPENVEAVNSDSTEYYMSLAANGNLYFASDRSGTLGSHDIYVSRYVNGNYTKPENLGPAINSGNMEHDPMIAPDEQYLIFTSADRRDSHGSGDLYYSLRNADGTWAPAQNMGARFNTDSYEYCSYLTPDGRYLFYSSDFDVKWISTKYLPWAR